MSACPRVSAPPGTCPSAPPPYKGRMADTDPRTGDEWQQRLAEQVAATVARRESRTRVRAQLNTARRHGLTKRHATKTSRATTARATKGTGCWPIPASV